MRSRRHISSQSRNFLKKKKGRGISIAALAIVSAVSWVFALSRLTHLAWFTIDSVKVIGADPDIANSLRAAAEAALKGDYIKLFSKSNSFLYPSKRIIEAVEAASPRLRDVAIEKDGLNSLVVSVNEKEEVAAVCDALPDFSFAGLNSKDARCYAVDPTGFVFKPIDNIADRDNRYYNPNIAPIGTPIGSYIALTTEFRALQSFYGGVREVGINPEGVLVKDGGEYELYARNPGDSASNDSMVVYFNDSNGIATELSNLVSFWKHAIDSAAPNKAVAFEYIDLRYGSNVFYREAK